MVAVPSDNSLSGTLATSGGGRSCWRPRSRGTAPDLLQRPIWNGSPPAVCGAARYKGRPSGRGSRGDGRGRGVVRGRSERDTPGPEQISSWLAAGVSRRSRRRAVRACCSAAGPVSRSTLHRPRREGRAAPQSVIACSSWADSSGRVSFRSLFHVGHSRSWQRSAARNFFYLGEFWWGRPPQALAYTVLLSRDGRSEAARRKRLPAVALLPVDCSGDTAW